ncbi:TPA: hypothetical protein QCI16_003054 [Enterobacter ludwigii]|uniref:hypothetical protein n=1 Tax=Enterobacter sp. 200527-13 TaxID=2995131 RepID=UPI0022BFDF42|nr:hypothetical protein [Enterobacter sp. 200527-13]GLH24089.1 hypothetical protein ENT52713_14850 [Enterobacter sp. 200527-13]HDR2588908.1 hypothetical protein [Enterobacter ludwigii]HDR2598876.1 hypothetical protein [Enterobacter ludwigii]
MKFIVALFLASLLSGCVIKEQSNTPARQQQAIAPAPPEPVLELQANGLTAEQNQLLEKMRKDMAEEAAKNKP